MFIFTKFMPDHIFLQNREKLNIKKFSGMGQATRHHALIKVRREQEESDAIIHSD
jgi:hypothetical protein